MSSSAGASLQRRLELGWRVRLEPSSARPFVHERRDVFYWWANAMADFESLIDRWQKAGVLDAEAAGRIRAYENEQKKPRACAGRASSR